MHLLGKQSSVPGAIKLRRARSLLIPVLPLQLNRAYSGKAKLRSKVSFSRFYGLGARWLLDFQLTAGMHQVRQKSCSMHQMLLFCVCLTNFILSAAYIVCIYPKLTSVGNISPFTSHEMLSNIFLNFRFPVHVCTFVFDSSSPYYFCFEQ